MTPAVARIVAETTAESAALARTTDALDEMLERPGALLAAARAAGMPVLDYTIQVVMPARARALNAKQRADAVERRIPYSLPVFACAESDGRLAENRARFEEE